MSACSSCGKDTSNGQWLCKFCDAKRAKAYRLANKEKVKESRRRSYEKNRESVKRRAREYEKTHKDQRARYYHEYYQAHKARKRDYDKKYENARKENDPNYKLRRSLRDRLRKSLKTSFKTGSAVRDLGCSINELQAYLESRFYPNTLTGDRMTWDNWGSGPGCWQIDHIVPLCWFDLTHKDQFAYACHWSNLQPLWHEDHVKKGFREVV